MGKIDEANNIYLRGNIVNIDESVVRSAFRTVEEILELERKEYPFELLIAKSASPDNGTLGYSDFVSGHIGLFPRMHEGIVLHEAAHYVMGKRRLYLNPKVESWAWYDHLINETFAETLTAQKYGYQNHNLFRNHFSFRELYNKNKEEFADKLNEMVKGNDSWEYTVQGMGLIHRSLEWAYKENPKDEDVPREVRRFKNMSKRSSRPDLWEIYTASIGLLSQWSALDLTVDRIFMSDLLDELKMGIKSSKTSDQFYFESIVKRLPLDNSKVLKR